MSYSTFAGPLELFTKYGNSETSTADGEVESADESHILEHPIHKRMDVAGLVEKYLDDYPGAVLETFPPRERQENKALWNYYVRCFGAVPMIGSDGPCTVSALVNRMTLLVGRDCVTGIYNACEQLRPKLKGLADLTHLVHGIKKLVVDDQAPRIQLQHVPKCKMV